MSVESRSLKRSSADFLCSNRTAPCVVIFAALLLGSAALAQVPDYAPYDRAIAQTSSSARTAALEDLLTRTPAGPLRQDALSWLAWEYHRIGNGKQAATAARELLGVDPENVLALALLSSNTAASVEEPSDSALSSAKRGIARFEHLQKPRGMGDGDFAALKREAYGMLNATVGYGYYQRKDYVTARGYLRNAVAVYPNDSRYAYALGVSDLNGRDLNPNEGYWMLARAVALNEGSPAGKQISEYASQHYQEAGGSASDWQKFVTAARADTNYSRASQSATAVATANNPVPPKPANTPPSSTSTTAIASVREPTAPPEPSAPPAILAERKMAPFPPGEPVSLGILIEASQARKESREAILQGLSDIVRRLRPKDEAFVLAFGNQLNFEQDLTQNYKLLEEAMDTIKPVSGTALYDAVGFAAGHLKRIAKNKNQALLVISDGQNNDSKDSSLQLASQIASVRIYCIGFGVDAPQSRYVLEALSGRTGGQATFISSPEQFETAAQQLAAVIYGPDRGIASR